MTRDEKLKVIDQTRIFAAGMAQAAIKMGVEDEPEESIARAWEIAGNAAAVMSAFLADL